MQSPDNFTIKSPKKVSLSALSPCSLHTNHSDNRMATVLEIRDVREESGKVKKSYNSQGKLGNLEKQEESRGKVGEFK